MQNKKLINEMKKLKIERDEDNLIIFKDIPKVFSILKKNPDCFNNDMKRVLFENFYENLRFVSLHIDVKEFLQKYKINRNLNLENEQDLSIIYSFFLKIISINNECDSAFCYLFFLNHNRNEFYRKRICEKSNRVFNRNEAIFDAVKFYELQFEVLIDSDRYFAY